MNQKISRAQFEYSKIISPNCLPLNGLLFTIPWIVDKPYCTVLDDHTDWCPEQSGDSELTGHSAVRLCVHINTHSGTRSLQHQVVFVSNLLTSLIILLVLYKLITCDQIIWTSMKYECKKRKGVEYLGKSDEVVKKFCLDGWEQLQKK